jgi:hypothetical protein
MESPKYLFIEPTVGIPVQPILAKSIIRSSEHDSIVWLQFKDSEDNTRDYFQRLIGEDIHYLDEVISPSDLERLKHISLRICLGMLDTIGEQSQGLHTLTLDGVPLGLYVVSSLQRHSNELCKNWLLPKENTKEILLKWIFFAKAVKELAARNPAKCTGIFTHHVYFYGFISELLHCHGVKSITVGSSERPIFKTGLANKMRYSWSMGKTCQNTIRIPTSCYEYAQLNRSLTNEYVDFIKKSVKSKVSSFRFASIVNTKCYEQLQSFLKDENISVWKNEDDPISVQSYGPHLCLYLHSFSDSTFTYDFDGYETIMDYYLSTASALAESFPNARFYIRPHPNVFSDRFSDRIGRDVELTIYFIMKLSRIIRNLVFVFPTVSNMAFFDLSENSVAITHHSPSMILEAIYSDRIIITSSSSIKIRLESPLVITVDKKTLRNGIDRLQSMLPSKPEISIYDKNYLMANAVPRLFYQPCYNNKILSSQHLPALLAGYSDHHKEYAPDLANKLKTRGVESYQDYLGFIREYTGNSSFKTLLYEIEYACNLIRDVQVT